LKVSLLLLNPSLPHVGADTISPDLDKKPIAILPIRLGELYQVSALGDSGSDTSSEDAEDEVSVSGANPVGNANADPSVANRVASVIGSTEVLSAIDAPEWVPKDGFGFDNYTNAAPVIYRSDPDSPDQFPDKPLVILPLWVPGTGVIIPPVAPPVQPKKIQVWFESTTNDKGFKVIDQSEQTEVEFKRDDENDIFRATLIYSDKKGFKQLTMSTKQRRAKGAKADKKRRHGVNGLKKLAYR